jgi:hypothetical protein
LFSTDQHPQEEVMSTASPTYQPTTPTTPLVAAAAATLVAATFLNALGIFADGTDGADHSSGEFFVIVGVTAAAVAVVFGLVVPRALRGNRTAGVGLGLAIGGLVLVLAFWSGLTPPLAVGGMLLGSAARRSGRHAGVGGVAVAIGALALVGYVAIYALDWMATNNIAGF